jgi:AcrR family transcriptional regulator
MADRRADIVSAALSLLKEGGAKGLSQPQVAKRVGLPQGHLTYYFPKKADLVAAVARELQQEIHRGFLAILARVRPSDAREATAEVLTETIMDDERSRAMLGLTIESERDKDVHDVLLEIVEQGRPLVAALLGPRGDDETVDLVQATIWGLELQQLFRRRKRTHVRAIVERLLGLLDSWGAAPTGPPRPLEESPERTPAKPRKKGKGAG